MQWLKNRLTHKNGLALFLRQGMAAWAAHWSSCTAQEKRREFFSNDGASLSKDTKISNPIVPDGMIREITELIATMAIRATEGVWMPK